MDEKLRKLRSESRTISASIIIGKNGINDEVIKNIKSQIKTYGLVKIKILKTYIENNDKKKIAKDLAERCNAQLVDQIGFTIVLAR
ncbi:MAG: YhbY family RNA-binding protein [Candidatus Woesearchaeota archaeon]